ncbi:MAG: hypothetical protein H9535_09270 [Ignavibacteria bacterium]|nr:hypothetical protein [Ignavibacteria bacterium]MBL7993510.1 hypothetical protein [Candidatus Kapabacteria bacterium]
MNIRALGIALILIGALMMAYTGFNFVTTEKVVDIGPLSINKDNNHSLQWSPIVGGALIVCGVVVLARSKKERT